MPFIPHTAADVQLMLNRIGVQSVHELFDEIPAEVPSANFAEIPLGLTEMEMLNHLGKRAKEDELGPCFIGAGSYDHHIPAAVWDLTSRGEFYTAYTPYQAEASQGTLQLLYEFQTMMASLAGLDVANASVYDGGSGLAEAILMAVRANRKSTSKQVLICSTINPLYSAPANTLVRSQGIELVPLPAEGGRVSISQSVVEKPVAVVIQQPNYFGILEDIDAITNWAHERNALVIAITNPLTLAVLKPPGEWGEQGADICCGDGQPLGVPMASGGPSFGFLCTKSRFVRQMPGRIVGRTKDVDGRIGYTLTLQAREQHIRRAKATSNICTNQGLLVTAATIYMSIMGLNGLRRTAAQCHANTTFLVEQLTKAKVARQLFNAPYFHECAIQFDGSATHVVNDMLRHAKILAGQPLNNVDPAFENALLVCATEKRTQAEMHDYVKYFSAALDNQ